MVALKIKEVETFLIHHWLLTRIHTDKGIDGIGEATFWAHPESVVATLRRFRDYLVGKDPLRIEHHWQYLYRSSSFRGASLAAALSAIDMALWDVVGKHYGAPVSDLLGGRCREKIRMCALVLKNDLDELVQMALRAVREGHTVIKIDPVPQDFPKMSHARVLQEAVRRVSAVREAVGPDVDIGVEVHRRLGPAEAVSLARELEPFRILFYEDPIQPDSTDSMAEVARRVSIPIATGERLHTIYEFKELLNKGAIHFIKPDVGLAGGITHCKKISALAEAYHAGVLPHNFLTPVCTAAHIQLCAAIPNFVVLEYLPDVPPKGEVVQRPLRVEQGYIKVPDSPGIGVEFNEEAPAKYPYVPREILTELREDGSVAYR